MITSKYAGDQFEESYKQLIPIQKWWDFRDCYQGIIQSRNTEVLLLRYTGIKSNGLDVLSRAFRVIIISSHRIYESLRFAHETRNIFSQNETSNLTLAFKSFDEYYLHLSRISDCVRRIGFIMFIGPPENSDEKITQINRMLGKQIDSYLSLASPLKDNYKEIRNVRNVLAHFTRPLIFQGTTTSKLFVSEYVRKEEALILWTDQKATKIPLQIRPMLDADFLTAVQFVNFVCDKLAQEFPNWLKKNDLEVVT